MTRALILAAGRGTRLAPLTDNRPKCLVPFNGRPLLDRQVEALTMGGATPVAMVTGYCAEVLAERAAVTFLNESWANTGAARSLATARSWLSTGNTVVSYGDIFYSAETVAKLVASEGTIAVAYDPNWLQAWSARYEDPRVDAETFRMENGNIVEIGGRIQDLATVEGQYMGLFKLTRSGWETLETILQEIGDERARQIDMTGLLALAIRRGVRIAAVPVCGPWGEIDNANDLAAYERLYPEA